MAGRPNKGGKAYKPVKNFKKPPKLKKTYNMRALSAMLRRMKNPGIK